MTLTHKPADTEIMKSLKRDRDMLTAMTPPDLTDSDRARVEKRQAIVIDTIRAGKGGSMSMPTEVEMKNPNAVGEDKHRVHEKYILGNKMTEDGKVVRCGPKEQSLFDEFKDNARTLNREDEDDMSNIANIETIRPQNNNGGSRLIDFPKAQFEAFAGSYRDWVFQNLNEYPPYQGIKAGLYEPWFRIDENGDILRDGTYHPKGEGRKANPFAGKEVKAEKYVEPAVKAAHEVAESVVQTSPPYTRCQATGKLSGTQCKMDPLTPDVPYCRFPNHRSQFVSEEKVG